MIETEKPISMTCADGAGIAKGAWLILANPMTVTTHAANDEAYCAGVAAEEKIANDGKTTIAVYMGGIFKATGQAAITTGETLALSGDAQELKKTDATCFGAKSMGICLTDNGADNETFMMKLSIGVGINA